MPKFEMIGLHFCWL